jgi:predicted amidohydrolase YtcJ
MPRFMVERTFPDGLSIPTNEQGREATAKVAARNAEVGVTWVHSYVTSDRKKTYCIYDGPDAEAIRKAAERNGLPIDNIVPVSVLDPYFYNW